MSEQRDRGKQRDGERSRSNERLLDRQAERESNTRTYPRYIPMAIDRAEGVTLIDVEGNEYVDCLAGAGSIPLGHNHPAVVGPVRETLDRERLTHPRPNHPRTRGVSRYAVGDLPAEVRRERPRPVL